MVRYRFDLPRFFVEACGWSSPTYQQIEGLLAVEKFECRVSISSGHGTRKSTLFAAAALWHMLCHEKSNTLITATNIQQMATAIWKEMADAKENLVTRFPWVRACHRNLPILPER